jgi:CCR4-NOT transcription complex subunit 1
VLDYAQVLFKNLGVDVKEVKPSSLLKSRNRETEGNPDFSIKDITTSQPPIVTEASIPVPGNSMPVPGNHAELPPEVSSIPGRSNLSSMVNQVFLRFQLFSFIHLDLA